jgi:hypothetical protein
MMLLKGSALLGIEEPDAYMLPEGPAQLRIIGAPHCIIVTAETASVLEPPELNCLLLRTMMHARQGHVRRLMLDTFIRDTPPVTRLLAWPVLIYAFLLRLWWQDLAHQTADRLTLLFTPNPELLKSAVLKLQVVNDPHMHEREITIDDVREYIEQHGAIGTAGQGISLQYKIGQAIHDDALLEGRIEDIDEWPKMPDFRAAVEKLQRAHATRKATASAAGQ